MAIKIITDDVLTTSKQLLSEGKTVSEISEMLGININTLRSGLQSNGIKLKPNKGNVHYFDNIDSYAKAYIVGFIAADGCLTTYKNTTTLTITINYDDKAILEFIKSEIGNSHKLLEIERPATYNKSKIIHHIRYSISDYNINKALNKLGITPRKSLTLKNIIKNIPFEYRDAFIIGFFDGDGTVFVTDKLRYNSGQYLCKDHSIRVSIKGTLEFLTGVCEHLGITVSHIHNTPSIPTLNFANKKDVIRFFKCYDNLPFYYKRKYDKFLEKINHSSFDKYKQDQTISSPIN